MCIGKLSINYFSLIIILLLLLQTTSSLANSCDYYFQPPVKYQHTDGTLHTATITETTEKYERLSSVDARDMHTISIGDNEAEKLKSLNLPAEMRSSINRVYLIRTQDVQGSQILRIFKPDSGESIHLAKNLFNSPFQGAGNVREFVASDIAKKMRFKQIQNAKRGNVNGQKGVLIEYLDCISLKSFIAKNGGESILSTPHILAELERIHLFDYLIGNIDRHSSNYMVCNESGVPRIYGIDHGNSFPYFLAVDPIEAQYMTKYEDLHKYYSKEFGGADTNLKFNLQRHQKFYYGDFVAELINISEQDWRQFLKSYNSPSQEVFTESDIQGFLVRRRFIIEHFNKKGGAFGEPLPPNSAPIESTKPKTR